MSFSGSMTFTDGTAANRVTLYGNASGLYVADASYGRPTLKGGGIWRDSSLSDGRRLAYAKRTNIVDSYTLGISGFTQDSIIQQLQDLSRLMESVIDYWTAGEHINPLPIYVIRQGPNETNIEYALLHSYSIPQEPDFFSMPLVAQINLLAADGVTFTVEHGVWSENPPGTGTAVQTSGQQVYNGVTYGRAATTAAEVFVNSRWNEANITHAYHYDASVPAFSANLIGGALPQALFPAVPAAGDILYVGSRDDGGLPTGGPFSTVVFDILAAAANITTIVFEYWSGGAWSPVALACDNTAQFTNTGVQNFNLEQEPTWTTTVINGVTAWWIRFRITAVGGGPTPPTQQNRNIYAVTWPAASIASTQIAGDIPALGRFYFATRTIGAAATKQQIERMVCGLRSDSRGITTFRSYLNLSTEQNPTNVDEFAGGTSAPVMTVYGTAPSGVMAYYNPAGASDGRVAIRLQPAISQEFFGTYHVFARVFKDSVVTDCYIYLLSQLNYNDNTYYWRSPNIYPPSQLNFYVADFGQLDIPSITWKTGQTIQHDLTIRIVNGTGAPALVLYDLILIPVDEWSLDTYDATNGYTQMNIGYRLDMDSISNQKRRLTSDLLVNATQKETDWLPVSNGPAILQHNQAQKLHTFCMQWDSTTSSWYSWPHQTGVLQAYRNQRYLGSRGAR